MEEYMNCRSLIDHDKRTQLLIPRESLESLDHLLIRISVYLATWNFGA